MWVGMGKVLETWSLVTQSHFSSAELPVPRDDPYQIRPTGDHQALDYSWGFDSSRSRLGWEWSGFGSTHCLSLLGQSQVGKGRWLLFQVALSRE